MENFKLILRLYIIKGEGMKRIVSGIMFMLLLMAMLSLSFNFKSTKAEWTGTVYIRADGSIDPPDAPIITYDKITYILIDNIVRNFAPPWKGIVVERSDIIIDGAGYSITYEGPGGGTGIYLEGISNVTVKNVNIRDFQIGLYLLRSFYINILDNNLLNNDYGMWVTASSNNIFYHNNFINNVWMPLIDDSTNNTWDNGYPSGGNFWSDYNGTDLNGDGIGDVAYIIDANNKDRYPLIFPIVWNYSNPVPIVWEGKIYSVAISSNSTVSGFKINQPQMQISFNVSGSSGTFGYCNVTIPKSLLRDNPWIITIDGQPPINIITTSNDTHSFLYFTYIHGNIKTVTIKGTHVISEYPLTIILTICTFTTTILVVLTKKGRLFMPRH
jgi:parallel beta-helix repeat protein